jgi:PITH domain
MPRHLRIYANHPQIVDFADAETTKPQLNVSILEGESSVTEYPLRVAAFASISSLSLFFVRLVSPHVVHHLTATE